MTHRIHGAAVADSAPSDGPQQTLRVPPIQVVASEESSGHATSTSTDLFSFDDAATSFSHSDTTCHSPAVEMSKLGSGNVVRLIPISQGDRGPMLRMEYTLLDPDSQECAMRLEDGREELTTVGDLLHRYRRQIKSLTLDATGVPNPESPTAMAKAVGFTFVPSSENSEQRPYSLLPLVSLREFKVSSSRAVSLCALIKFLHYCPLLQKLVIHNSRRHAPVAPEDVDTIDRPNISSLREVYIDGLLLRSVELLLGKLCPSLNREVKVEAHFYGTGLPELSYGPAFQKFFSSMRHVQLTYTDLGTEHPRSTSDSPDTDDQHQDRYLFTFTDIASRMQLHWHWTPPHHSVPNLGHIGLSTPGLSKVRNVSLHVRDVKPSYGDFYAILQSFNGMKDLELHSTYSLTDSATSQPSAPAEADSSVSPTPHVTQREREPVEPVPGNFVSHYNVYKIRRGVSPILRAISDVPLLFAVGLTRTLYPSVSPSAAGHSERGAEAISTSTGPLPLNTELHPQVSVSAHTRWLARHLYTPIWALMVRKPTQWEP